MSITQPCADEQEAGKFAFSPAGEKIYLGKREPDEPETDRRRVDGDEDTPRTDSRTLKLMASVCAAGMLADPEGPPWKTKAGQEWDAALTLRAVRMARGISKTVDGDLEADNGPGLTGDVMVRADPLDPPSPGFYRGEDRLTGYPDHRKRFVLKISICPASGASVVRSTDDDGADTPWAQFAESNLPETWYATTPVPFEAAVTAGASEDPAIPEPDEPWNLQMLIDGLSKCDQGAKVTVGPGLSPGRLHSYSTSFPGPGHVAFWGHTGGYVDVQGFAQLADEYAACLGGSHGDALVWYADDREDSRVGVVGLHLEANGDVTIQTKDFG